MTAERRRMSRARILNGANDILDAGVYGDLTVDALARSLHMSKSTLYKYFASKEDVIVSLIDSACTETERDLESRNLQSNEPMAAVMRFTEVLANHASRVPRAAILQQSRLPAACQDRIEVTRATLGRALREILSRGNEAGVFSYPHPSLAASSFMAAAESAMKAAARGEVPGTRADAVGLLLELFLPGLTQIKA